MQPINFTRYRLINSVSGWLAFAVATVVYLLTIEPTASFWDCGEFIASGYKMLIGHPPGAPFFMLLMRLFTMLAPTTELIPVFANALSALASSFTILLLFWSITHLARKMVKAGEGGYTLAQVLLIVGSGMVGALAYTFSDSFWFSAVEAEVYATSSLFTALVFWLILKWEDVADSPHANRFLLLIAFLMGLSIGVHLLNLLAIPAIVLIYYFRKFTVTPWGVIKALLLGMFLLLAMMYGIIQGLVVVLSQFELLFVNGFGLPFKTGVFFFLAALIAGVIWAIVYTHRHGRYILNTALLCFALILIGYSSFFIIVIRSTINPPMDQNSPDNMFSLLYYLSREQYGDRPLITGQSFDAPVTGREQGAPFYIQRDGRYHVASHRVSLTYDERFVSVFPRMFSSESHHVSAYKEWTGFQGRPIRVTGEGGEPEIRHVPTFGENLKFFFRYQIGHMYWRYFMWNFAGRQNDLQGHGDVLRGNWISGIPFIDTPRLGPQELLPDTFRGKAHNRYFMLPLLLGIAGLAFQYLRGQRDFWVVGLLFVMTGVAIVVYLNQTPFQPRERDYAFSGSFYAFSIWIGLGVMGLFQLIRKAFDNALGAGLAVGLSLAFVPGLMAQQNWDDHDRSGSYIPIDFAHNVLISCDPNAILFTFGDNDTFPLWYAQEVEGIRTDVRVSNLSYLQADWYVEQMYRKVYESEPFPGRLTKDQFVVGTRDVIPVIDRLPYPLPVKQAVEFMFSENPQAKISSPFERGERINFLPSRNLFLEVDREAVRATGTVRPERMHLVADTMQWQLPGHFLLKNGLVIKNVMAHNNWERPIYFAITVSNEVFQGLDQYFQLEGMVYRVVPIESQPERAKLGSIDTEIMFNNLMNKYRIRSVNDPDVYMNETTMRIVSNYRNIYGRLAEALLNEGKRDSALLVLNRVMELVPVTTVPLNFFALSVIEGFYRAGSTDRALEYSTRYMQQSATELEFIIALPQAKAAGLRNDVQMNLFILQELHRMASRFGAESHRAELEGLFGSVVGRLEGMM